MVEDKRRVKTLVPNSLLFLQLEWLYFRAFYSGFQLPCNILLIQKRIPVSKKKSQETINVGVFLIAFFLMSLLSCHCEY